MLYEITIEASVHGFENRVFQSLRVDSESEQMALDHTHYVVDHGLFKFDPDALLWTDGDDTFDDMVTWGLRAGVPLIDEIYVQEESVEPCR